LVLILGLFAIWLYIDVAPTDAAIYALSQGQAARAERLLARASSLNPRDPEPWLLRLELLRLEDRQTEAQPLGWQAYNSVRSPAKRPILKAMTLAMLADTPDELARDTLRRWIGADAHDVDARVALLRRIAATPRSNDPDRAARMDALTKILAEHPDHALAREALILALADSGEIDRGREVLHAWPKANRGAAYQRLAGRWALEYDRQPERAIEPFREALKELPHDWRTRYRLARALRNAGRDGEAAKAAAEVEKLREVLDPVALGNRLDHDFSELDDPKSRLDLAELCEKAGLTQLASAWKRDAADDSPLLMPPPR
jgi:thioredoxin-like negative regulator of GroEL